MEEITIEFISNKEQIKITCNDRNEKIEKILKKYLKITNKFNQTIDFFYKGIKINLENKIKDINNSDNIIIINVKENNINNSIKSSLLPAPMLVTKEIKHSKIIICPICKKSCIINFNDFKLSLGKCEQSHQIFNKLLSEYDKTQIIDEKKLCNECHNNNDNLFTNKFYSCLTCRMKLCSLCRTNHEENHIIVDQGLVNYICKIHGKTFVSYCQICQNNLCILCEKDHDKDHNITDFRKMIPNYNVRQKLNEFRELIDKFIDNIKSIIDKLNSVINNIEIYYRINNDIINCYERKYKNYQIYKNIQNIEEYNRLVIEDIKNIINDNYEINKFNYIYEMYNLMNKKKS